MKTFTNATLLEIATPGPLAGNGDPGEAQTVWTGRAKGYLKRTRRNVVSGGVSVALKRDTFTILRTAGAQPLEQAGPDWEACTVVIRDERLSPSRTRRFIVRGMENRAAATPVDSIRLELDTEAAA